jgi:ubiquinone/menaquinone biosynthesis C-methylase UbiE
LSFNKQDPNPLRGKTMSVQEIFAKIAKENATTPQSLIRMPEPEQVTNEEGSVNDYQAMMKTNMTANYATALDLIARTRSPGGDRVLDLCCGPGHVTICLQKYLGYKKIKGLDLAPKMVEAGISNARREHLQESITFSVVDVTKLSGESAGSYDLVSLINAAHHFPNLMMAEVVLCEAERVTKPSGLVFVSDLARLKSESVTQDFVEFAGADYGDYMRKDFLNSMKAAWLPTELASAIPKNSKRTWYSIAFGGLPFFQALVGLPEGRQELFINSSIDWAKQGFFPNVGSQEAFSFMAACLTSGDVRKIKAGEASRLRTAS